MEVAPKKSEIMHKHILAIDYGQKFTGLANYKVGIDPFIFLYGRVAYQSDEQLIQEILNIIEEEFIEIVVIGIPRFTDGKESKMTQTVKDFAHKLSSLASIPTYFIDETLTTFEAEERMKNDPKFNFEVDMKQIDAVAASIILEEFVNSSSEE